MPDATVRARPGSTPVRRGLGAGAVLAIALSGASIAALGASGHGLLTGAGSPSGAVRGAAVVAAVVGLVVLISRQGPIGATRSITVVGVVGIALGVATLPFSPVSVLHGSDAPVSAPEGAARGQDPFVVDPPGAEGTAGSSAPTSPGVGTFVLPSDVTVSLRDGDVVVHLPGGGSTVLGSSQPASPGAPTPGTTVEVEFLPTELRRSDGGPIGPGVGLGGTAVRSGSGTVVVTGDRLLPAPSPLDAGPEPTPLDRGVDAALTFVLLAFAAVAFAPPFAGWARRFIVPMVEPDRDPDPEGEPPAAGAGLVEDELATVLRAMLTDPDPRTAVIGAYAGLLRALADAGHPRRPEETPHEHLWRSLGALGVRRGPVHRLAELFVLARFTPHPVDEDQRRAAVGALADAIADLRLTDDTLGVLEAAGRRP